ncbi:MAG: hypothetical protein ACYDG6_11415 [Thermincolia bacterium]
MGLCEACHREPHTKTFWRLYWEADAVVRHGWWRGQIITLGEWVDVNAYRISKARVDVKELLNFLTGKGDRMDG